MPVRPDPVAEAGARHQLVVELHRRRVDVQDPPGGQVPRRHPADRRRRGVHLQAELQPEGHGGRAVRVRGRAGAGRRGEGRRLHGGLPPGGAERELPVPDLLRQLQHDHHPEQLQPGKLAELVHRHRAVRARPVHGQGGRHLQPQRVVLGHQGAALADPVHLLRDADPVDPRADRRDHRRARAVLGDRRRGAAEQQQLQRHQAEVQRAPRAVHAQRRGPVHRPAGAPGGRAHAQPARRSSARCSRATPTSATTARSRRSSRPPTPASRSARRTSPRPSRCSRRPGTAPGSTPSW